MKYRFEVIYQTENIKKASEFLKRLDLNIGEIGIKETIVFSSQKDLEISIVKDHIRQAMNAFACVLLHIEGGKVE